MINKKYWDEFYKKEYVTRNQTNFAEYILNYIKKNEIEGPLLDIACGNGRDSIFFSKNGLETTGIDLSIDLESNDFTFIRENMFTYDYEGYNIFYLRFVVHSLKEAELDTLIEKFSKIKTPYHIFIETRSSKGITNEEKSETNFSSSIGSEHFRMLYSKEYLDEKLSKYFKIMSSTEDKNIAIYKTDNPYCLRYILTNK